VFLLSAFASVTRPDCAKKEVESADRASLLCYDSVPCMTLLAWLVLMTVRKALPCRHLGLGRILLAAFIVDLSLLAALTRHLRFHVLYKRIWLLHSLNILQFLRLRSAHYQPGGDSWLE
jgi:hypothetical protein